MIPKPFLYNARSLDGNIATNTILLFKILFSLPTTDTKPTEFTIEFAAGVAKGSISILPQNILRSNILVNRQSQVLEIQPPTLENNNVISIEINHCEGRLEYALSNSLRNVFEARNSTITSPHLENFDPSSGKLTILIHKISSAKFFDKIYLTLWQNLPVELALNDSKAIKYTIFSESYDDRNHNIYKISNNGTLNHIIAGQNYITIRAPLIHSQNKIKVNAFPAEVNNLDFNAYITDRPFNINNLCVLKSLNTFHISHHKIDDNNYILPLRQENLRKKYNNYLNYRLYVNIVAEVKQTRKLLIYKSITIELDEQDKITQLESI